jgi:serine protease 16
MLAAWCRSKLPHLFHAAVSSSAPVVAIANMQGYNDAVADDLADSSVGGSAECLATVREAFASLGQKLSSAEGRRELEGKFGVCGSMTLEKEENRAVFAQDASDPLIPQSNDPA